METNNTRSLDVVKENIRLKAIRMILAAKTQVQVAKEFGVSRQAVAKWVKAYREGGDEALKAKRPGRPKGSSLPLIRARQIVKTILEYRPDQLGLPFCLWSQEAVARLIEEKYGVQLSLRAVSRYIKRWGFVGRKPVWQALEEYPDAAGLWLKEEYSAIWRHAKAEGALTCLPSAKGVLAEVSTETT